MLAWIAADLGETHIEIQATDSGMRLHRVENPTPLGVAIPAFVNELAHHSAGKRRAIAIHLIDKSGDRIGGTRGILAAMAQKRNQIAQAEKP